MQIKWVVFFTAVYLFGTIFGGLMEQTYVGSDEATVLEDVIGFDTYHIMGITVPKPSMGWISSVGRMMLWDYAFFKNPDGSANEWTIVKWLFFLPISLGLLVVFFQTFIPILFQGIRAVRFW